MEKYIILGHENPDVDSIVSGYLLEKLMKSKGYIVKFIIPDKVIDKESFDICNKFNLNSYKFQSSLPLDENTKYILVDHHERKINGIIAGIVDHHPTSKDIKVPFYRNENSSSTACILCSYENEKFFTKKDVELAVMATMVDTASFHSTKTVEKDIIWAKKMCEEYNLNYNELYKIGLCLTDITDLQNAAFNGLKNYNFNNHKVSSSYIQVENSTKIFDEILKIIKILQTYLNNSDIELFVFIVHDMTKFQTTTYTVNSETFEVKKYENYTSRGSTIIPEVEEKLKVKTLKK